MAENLSREMALRLFVLYIQTRGKFETTLNQNTYRLEMCIFCFEFHWLSDIANVMRHRIKVVEYSSVQIYHTRCNERRMSISKLYHTRIVQAIHCSTRFRKYILSK